MTAASAWQVRWSQRALADLRAIHEYIVEDQPAAADHQLAVLFEAAEALALFPRKGRPGRLAGTRELVVPNTSYILVYEITGETVFVLAVMHGARLWPGSF